MRRPSHDPAQMHAARLLRLEWIRNIVLPNLACAPAGSVQIAIINREIDVGQQRRNRLEALQKRRQLSRIGRLCGNFNHLLNRPASVRPMPQPDRTRQIFQRYHNAVESISLGRIVRRTELKHHLLLRAHVLRLQVPPFAQIPEVHPVAVFLAEQQLGHDTVFDH